METSAKAAWSGLLFYVERVGESYALFACRGAARDCERNKSRQKFRHCDECVIGRGTETVARLRARIRGDS